MTKRPKAFCPVCGDIRALKADGTFPKHKRYDYSGRYGAPARYTYECEGTGKEPVKRD